MRTSALLSSLAAAAAVTTAALPAHADARIAWLELDGALAERPGPFDWLTGETTTTLTDLVWTFDEIAGDEDIDGVVLRLKSPAYNAAQIEELGHAIARVREAGKTVHAFGDIYEPGALRLASYTDDVIMQQGGAAFLPGLYAEEMFLADTLALVGAKADFVQIGDYKGAEEMYVNSAPSKAWDENFSQLLDSLYDEMREEMMANRGLSGRQLDSAMEEAWFADGATAASVGLIDTELDRADLTDYLREAYSDESIRFDTSYDPSRSTASMDMSNPFALLQTLMVDPANDPVRDTIAVVHIDGAIVDGESTPASAFGGGSVGAETIRDALKDIANDDHIKGVVMRINSPGGSAIASENIWQGVRRVAEVKPVWVSVGSMAASGGYYIAVAGDKIYVSSSGIVGSIGVVSGKFVIGGLYEKLGINTVARARGPHADLFSQTQEWTPAQRELMRQRMTETYDLFALRVSEGRRGINLGKTAEGRLFAGDKAVALKMADAVGGLHDTILGLAAEVGLEDEYDVLHYPGPQSFDDLMSNFTSMFGVSAESVAVAALRELVGETAWPSVRDALNSVQQLRTEPVLLTAPRILIFR